MITTKAERIAAYAISQMGVAFHLHGRTDGRALDCVGLVHNALLHADISIKNMPDYTMRGDYAAQISHCFVASGLRPITAAQMGVGDIAHVICGPRQSHLIIQCLDGFVHAHAGLRRVVMTPKPIAWPILAAWHAGE